MAGDAAQALCGPDHLLPGHVSICAYAGDCGCFYGKWGATGVPRECPLHGRLRKTAHDELLRRILQLVHSLDGQACMFPQCVIRFISQAGQGRFGSIIRMYMVDLVVYLSNGRIIAFECDGRSHDNQAQRLRDWNKESWLNMHDVVILRLNIRDAVSKSCTLTMQQLYDRELAKARSFVKSLI